MAKGSQHSTKLNTAPTRHQAIRMTFMVILMLFLAACSAELQTAADITSLEVSAATLTMTSPCFDSGCHSDLIAQEEEYKHRPYVDQKCLECHENYHSEETQHDYLEHDILLCLGCHADSDLGNTHPVGEGIIDPNTENMMTCTSTCHLQHTAPYPYLLTLSGSGALCVSCHQEFLN